MALSLEAVGQRLAGTRRDHSLSQQEMAERLGISPRAYQNYERGEREIPASLLVALHHEFGVEPLWVLTGALIPDDSLDLVAEIVSTLESVLASSGTTIAPDKKGKAVKLFAQYFAATGNVSESVIANLLSLTE